MSFPHSVMTQEVTECSSSSSCRLSCCCVSSLLSFSSPLLCVCVCCLCEGVCDSGTVKSDVWDAKGGIVPYLSASPAPAVWSRRPRLLLPPLSSWLLPLSLCGGLCCHPSFPPFLPAFLSVHVFFGSSWLLAVFINAYKTIYHFSNMDTLLHD